jgi:hypothetical protein
MDAAPMSCATCGWRGIPAGAFCSSCGAQLRNTLAQPMLQPHIGAPANSDNTRIGGRIALLVVAVALLIVFTTLFIVGLIANRSDPNDPAPTLAPNAPSATALLTVAPQRWRQGQAHRHVDSYRNSSATDTYSASQYADHIERWRIMATLRDQYSASSLSCGLGDASHVISIEACLS